MLQKYFNSYYYKDIKQLISHIELDSKYILNIKSDKELGKKGNYEYINVVNLIGRLNDIQTSFQKIHANCLPTTKIVISYYNYLWEPLLKLAEVLGLKKKQIDQNWLTLHDIKNLLFLSDFSVITTGKRLLIPIEIPLISYFINRYIAPLPLINNLCLTNYVIAKQASQTAPTDFSVSIIIPARNEEGNINIIIKRIPKIGKSQEIIFIEGHSKDNTWNKINESVLAYRGKNIKAYKQEGIGKADAVRMGIREAKGDIIIILDADLSVPPEDIPKFYEALSKGNGEFINGSRLVYPMERQSMRFLNIIGNKMFSILFSWILNQRFTDTLCGTKAFFRSDYIKIQKLKKYFGDFDPFGDFELIFGAVRLNLKVVEIPIRYRARMYGASNISRFTHGWLLLKMCFYALKQFKLS